MESSELDRLDSSVKQLVDRLSKAEHEREQLRTERQELKNRLDQQTVEVNRIADQTLANMATNEQFKEVKVRIAALVKRIEEIENLI